MNFYRDIYCSTFVRNFRYYSFPRNRSFIQMPIHFPLSFCRINTQGLLFSYLRFPLTVSESGQTTD